MAIKTPVRTTLQPRKACKKRVSPPFSPWTDDTWDLCPMTIIKPDADSVPPLCPIRWWFGDIFKGNRPPRSRLPVHDPTPEKFQQVIKQFYFFFTRRISMFHSWTVLHMVFGDLIFHLGHCTYDRLNWTTAWSITHTQIQANLASRSISVTLLSKGSKYSR